MSFSEHECKDCGYTTFNNELESKCEKCQSMNTKYSCDEVYQVGEYDDSGGCDE